MNDAFGRQIDYLRISVTDKCNLRCRYCMPETGVPYINHDKLLTIEDYCEILAAAKELGIDKVRFTGGEPLVKKGIVALIQKASQIGFRDISLTTNGILLESMADDLQAAGLNRVNISLDTLDPNKYHAITRWGHLEDVYQGIEAARRVGFTPIKLNVVLMSGFNDDEVTDFFDLAHRDDVDVRFIELMPIGTGRDFKDLIVSNQRILASHPELEAVPSLDNGPATYYRCPGKRGRIGFISPMSCKFCSSCNRLRVDATGHLIPCLHSDLRLSLSEALGDRDKLKALMVQSAMIKPQTHHLDEGALTDKPMNRIGG
ncbi:GTP 3',8-cyclase MoaA [Peptoniphilus equinus]|uniref:GTP 3',8-cyclase n=1 Tax=Peptoniphilus equinus TaxID=3016343 RepID=A0ABY7QVG1_9FIRM|nr:GTP 3',8-cyclase MoaA [Peptoniphilus equinus]WBW50069.1 GTP 3',8-cyclase MoaA [Peptoniphilus equinus]